LHIEGKLKRADEVDDALYTFFGFALINLRRPWAQQKAKRKGSPPGRLGVARWV
jgi:hypothetical protein